MHKIPEDMEKEVKAEKVAAATALSGWKKMLAKALQPEDENVDIDVIKERIKSLDAAWARYEKAHSQLISKLTNLDSNDAEIEQEKWEKELEDYCLAKEKAMATVKNHQLSHLKVMLIKH